MWVCTDCKAPRLNPSTEACPSCGGLNRIVDVHLMAATKSAPTIKGTLSDPTLPSKKRKRVEFFMGQQLNHKTGEYVAKDWRIDRRQGIYWERIRDTHGRFVRWVTESLVNHMGHGSDKTKP